MQPPAEFSQQLQTAFCRADGSIISPVLNSHVLSTRRRDQVLVTDNVQPSYFVDCSGFQNCDLLYRYTTVMSDYVHYMTYI
jgi:hypothetical protein